MAVAPEHHQKQLLQLQTQEAVEVVLDGLTIVLVATAALASSSSVIQQQHPLL
jgi:hypothetical protein